MKLLLSLSSLLLVVLIEVLLLARMIPKVELVLVFCVAPPAISRLRMTLLVAPAPTPVLVSQIAAVEADVLELETVRFRPAPAMRPSMVTLSAPVSLMIAPTMLPVITLGPPLGAIVTEVYDAAPTPLAFNDAVAVSVVSPMTSS
ncbi:hypothetical protein [Candidatus Amarobacter glycogenicus]|uniref:hypothetical protein n=1 Tax=Candidatus Amarobacter glycogenicus TaxID=3140699 RepID=UPI0031360F17|nr:hypothetical protein [Dehalococcoidia bacterium]